MLLNHKEVWQKWGIAFGTQKTTTQPANPLKVKKIKLTSQPLEIFSKLQNHHPTTYLLESIEGPKKLAKYSFIGFDPKITVQSKNGKTRIKNHQTGETTTKKTTDPLRLIEQLLNNQAVPNSRLRFVGGAVGYISYDAVRYWEKLPQNCRADFGFPDLILLILQYVHNIHDYLEWTAIFDFEQAWILNYTDLLCLELLDSRLALY